MGRWSDNKNYPTIFLKFKEITVPKRYNVFSVKFSICNRILQKCFLFPTGRSDEKDL